MNSASALDQICEYFLFFYSEANRDFFEECKARYETGPERGEIYNLCDMVLLSQIAARKKLKIFETANIWSWQTFDHNLNMSEPGFVMERGYKKISWQAGMPYGTRIESGEQVRFCALHFQGNAKQLIENAFLNAFPETNESDLRS